MARPRTGSIYEKDNRFFVRYTYTDDAGRRKTVKRIVPENTISHAQKLLRRLLNEHDKKGRPVSVKIKSFAELADWYVANYAKAPEYYNDTKIAGLRSWQSVRYRVDLLRQRFASQSIQSINYSKIEAYKQDRLSGRLVHPKSNARVSITSVNRELEVLRRMLNLAVRERWLDRNPMLDGDQLIQKTDEDQRQHVLSFEEEKEFLDGLGERLVNLVIFAIETGMRRGEIFKLAWDCVDLNNRMIFLIKKNTKTATPRTVLITPLALKILKSQLQIKPASNFVFPAAQAVYKQYQEARANSKFSHIRFHDLRHTFCTRLIEAGVPAEQALKMSGHSQMTTFLRYVNVGEQHLKSAANALSDLRDRNSKSQSTSDS